MVLELLRKFKTQKVATAIDARMGEVYWSVYLEGKVKSERICKPEQVEKLGAEFVGVGSGWKIYKDSLIKASEIKCVEPELYPDSSDLVDLSILSIELGKKATHELPQPTYLRKQCSAKVIKINPFIFYYDLDMWKWIQKLASPKVFYETTNKLIPWFFWPFIVLIIIGLYWGLVLAPADYQQGESFRIIYIHVPSAWMSMLVYFIMAVAGGIGLIWQIKMAEVVAKVSAPIGATFTLIALVTGAVWG